MTSKAHEPATSLRLRMRVDGMSCPSCEHHVEKALRQGGAREVEADFRRGEVRLVVDAPADAAALAAAVGDAGYTPGPLKPVEAAAPGAENLVDYRLPVEGMTCAGCERHVAEALRGAGATQAQADFRRGEAHVRAPEIIDPARFVAALAETPYRAGTPEPLTSQPALARRTGRSSGSDRYDLAIVGS